MKKICCVLALVLLHLDVFSQKALLTGKIVDSDTLSQAFAIISLMELPDSVVKGKAAADEAGRYRFSEIPYGSYCLKIDAPGFEIEHSPAIQLDTDTVYYAHALSKIKVLKEVSVQGQRSAVRIEDGKTIVDVANTLGNAGQTAVDILRRSPGVSVDQNGVIQLRGRSGVLVMIDDKVMYLSPDALANLLRSIPSEQIKEIELITNPSAKYDAAGNAGMINIRLKKGAYEGFNGRLNLSIGYSVFARVVGGTNLTYKKKKHTVNLNYQYTNRKGWNTSMIERINEDTAVTNNFLYNKGLYRSPNQNHNVQLTGDYRVSKKTSFNYDFNNTFGDNRWITNSDSDLKNRAGELVATYRSEEKGTFYSHNSYSGIGFMHRPDTLGTLVSGTLGFNRYNGDVAKNQVMDSYDASGTSIGTPFIFNLRNNLFSNNFIGQLDLSKKIKAVKVEMGLKGTKLFMHNPNDITITENDTVSPFDNNLNYHEQILAAYTTLSRKFNTWSLQCGVRIENTNIAAEVTSADTSFTRKYTNLFPSGVITYKKSDLTSYSLSYSRRITRPTLEQLNPVLHILDPFTVRSGDPYLLPQFANNVELTHSALGGVLTSALSYSYVNQPIVWVNKYDATVGRYITGIRNVDNQQTYGLMVSYNKSMFKWWSMNNNFFGYYTRFKGNAGFGEMTNEIVSWNIKTTQRFNFSKVYSLELYAQYDAPSSYAFSRYRERNQVNLTLQRKILKDKGTLKLAVNDIFWAYYFEGKAVLGDTRQHTLFKWDNRSVILTFNYRFGNQLMKEN